MKVREDCVRFLEENQANFEPFLEEELSFVDYVTKLRQPASWGGHLELYALSLYYE
jgi:OTU-like cysteine protease